LRHIDDSMRVVVKDHTIGIKLLDRLETFRVPIAELFIEGILGNSWELKHFHLSCTFIFIFRSSICNIEVECDEITCVQLFRLPVIRDID
jgi:hypothetical protein